jgi:hypothetical protein
MQCYEKAMRSENHEPEERETEEVSLFLLEWIRLPSYALQKPISTENKETELRFHLLGIKNIYFFLF